MNFTDLLESAISASVAAAVLLPAVWSGCKRMEVSPLLPVVGLGIGLAAQALWE